MPLIGALALLVIHWALLALVPRGFVADTYWFTLVVLQAFEHAGLPTLRGSLDGWPVPTRTGLLVACLGWFVLYAGVIYACGLLRHFGQRAATPTT